MKGIQQCTDCGSEGARGGQYGLLCIACEYEHRGEHVRATAYRAKLAQMRADVARDVDQMMRDLREGRLRFTEYGDLVSCKEPPTNDPIHQSYMARLHIRLVELGWRQRNQPPARSRSEGRQEP